MTHYVILSRAHSDGRWEYRGMTEAVNPEEAVKEVINVMLDDELRVIPTESDENGDLKYYREYELDL